MLLQVGQQDLARLRRDDHGEGLPVFSVPVLVPPDVLASWTVFTWPAFTSDRNWE